MTWHPDMWGPRGTLTQLPQKLHAFACLGLPVSQHQTAPKNRKKNKRKRREGDIIPQKKEKPADPVIIAL
uniref:Uncharacterized protein n=1 Tax=Oryza glumipatula TaxID=40148 RepID=A0A0E0A7Q0_9ORYZ